MAVPSFEAAVALITTPKLAAQGPLPPPDGAFPGPIDPDTGEPDTHNFCVACLGRGALICCDDCAASYHYDCLNPPLKPGSVPSSRPFFCPRCEARRNGTDHAAAGADLFAPLIWSVRSLQCAEFTLPCELLHSLKGVPLPPEDGLDHSFKLCRACVAKARPDHQTCPECGSCILTTVLVPLPTKEQRQLRRETLRREAQERKLKAARLRQAAIGASKAAKERKLSPKGSDRADGLKRPSEALQAAHAKKAKPTSSSHKKGPPKRGLPPVPQLLRDEALMVKHLVKLTALLTAHPPKADVPRSKREQAVEVSTPVAAPAPRFPAAPHSAPAGSTSGVSSLSASLTQACPTPTGPGDRASLAGHLLAWRQLLQIRCGMHALNNKVYQPQNGSISDPTKGTPAGETKMTSDIPPQCH